MSMFDDAQKAAVYSSVYKAPPIVRFILLFGKFTFGWLLASFLGIPAIILNKLDSGEYGLALILLVIDIVMIWLSVVGIKMFIKYKNQINQAQF